MSSTVSVDSAKTGSDADKVETQNNDGQVTASVGAEVGKLRETMEDLNILGKDSELKLSVPMVNLKVLKHWKAISRRRGVRG